MSSFNQVSTNETPINERVKDINEYILGIDLGTTHSCIGVWERGGVTIIRNEYGLTTTPSVVFFPKGKNDPIVGKAAVGKLGRAPSRTIYGAKRLIGNYFEEDWAREFNYHVLSDDNGNNLIRLSDRILYPEQVSAEVLKKMRKVAEDYLGVDAGTIKKAVITVPAYFNDRQRYATRVAADLAGLEVSRMINEPTAACLCYGIDKLEDDSHVLVYDCGGGTLDVSLLSLSSGLFEVIATSGDCELGGLDFDRALYKYFCEQKSLKLNSIQTGRMMEACENLKIQLSYTDRAQTTLDNFLTNDQIIERSINASDSESEDDHDIYNLELTIDYEKWLEITKPILEKAEAPVLQVLKDGKVKGEMIEQIVLVGGSTRIRALQSMLSRLFPGKTLNKSINPDEAVAYGATIQAAILADTNDSKIQEMVLVDVTPLSLGIETEGGLMSVIVPRNTSIPTEKQAYYTTTENNQTSVTVEIFQGERAKTFENRVLGRFKLTGIPPCARGLPKIKVTFKIDADGLLKISAEDEISGVNQDVVIDSSTTRLSKEEIEQRILEAEAHQRQDEVARQIISEQQKCLETFRELRRILHNLDKPDSVYSRELKAKTQIMEEELTSIINNSGWELDTLKVLEEFHKTVENCLIPLYNEFFSYKKDDDQVKDEKKEIDIEELNQFLTESFT